MVSPPVLVRSALTTMVLTLLCENTSVYTEAGHWMLPQWGRWFLYTWLGLRYVSNGGGACTQLPWRIRWAVV
eukprot:3166243-Pyramimonas_sp.AAC.1